MDPRDRAVAVALDVVELAEMSVANAKRWAKTYAVLSAVCFTAGLGAYCMAQTFTVPGAKQLQAATGWSVALMATLWVGAAVLLVCTLGTWLVDVQNAKERLVIAQQKHRRAIVEAGTL